MTLRIKIILIIFTTVIIAVLIGVGISLFTFFRKSKAPMNEPPPVVSQQEVSKQEQEVITQGEAFIPPPLTQEISEEGKARDAITGIILPFVERLGSYSNQSNFENMSDLLPFMTSSMQTWAQKQIDDARAKPLPELYKGTTTRTMNHTINKIDIAGGSAEVLVETQRKELIGTTTNFRTYNQTILVRLKNVDGVWLVDGAFWQ